MDDSRLHASVVFVSKRILYWTAHNVSVPTFEVKVEERPATHNPVMSAWMDCPKSTFAIQFAERLTSPVDHEGETIELRSDLLNIGPRHLVNGNVWSVGDSYLRNERMIFKPASHSPTGRAFQLTNYPLCVVPVEKTDVIVEPEEMERWSRLQQDGGT